MNRVVVAFSAGVDSTFLLKVALDCLGPDNVLACTSVSPSLAAAERESVSRLASQLGATLKLIETSEMDNPLYAENSPKRCFYCKQDLYRHLKEAAAAFGASAIVNGANADDTGDYRPGMDAAKEAGVRSPLLEVGLNKAEIRELSKQLGLPTWDKPALACLSSRIPYGTPVTIGALTQIDRAEAMLRAHGFGIVRVRHHGTLARIEVPAGDLPRLLEEPLHTELLAAFKDIGYTYITADLQGFRSGSGNEVLGRAKR
jgi:uncharacterized protein